MGQSQCYETFRWNDLESPVDGRQCGKWPYGAW